MTATTLHTRLIDDCRIEDEPSFRAIGLYRDLKQVLRKAAYPVRLMPVDNARWDHALLLNLAFWQPGGAGDVMVDDVIPADVVCHVAWHHLATRVLTVDAQPLSAEALALGEAIASAFDLYLVGRLLDCAPDSSFLETQVPALGETAEVAGVDETAFAALMESVRADPERAFEDLRQLLYDAMLGLARSADADAALGVLTRLQDHRFGSLLHHYELANWLQHARVAPVNASADSAREVDAQLRTAGVSLDWLARRWIDGRAD